jgi:hypothetical protein
MPSCAPYGTLPKHQTKHRRSGDRSAVSSSANLLILQCPPRPEQRPLDGRHAAVRLVEPSQSMGGLPRRSHVYQPGRIRIRIGGSPMVTCTVPHHRCDNHDSRIPCSDSQGDASVQASRERF